MMAEQKVTRSELIASNFCLVTVLVKVLAQRSHRKKGNTNPLANLELSSSTCQRHRHYPHPHQRAEGDHDKGKFVKNVNF